MNTKFIEDLEVCYDRISGVLTPLLPCDLVALESELARARAVWSEKAHKLLTLLPKHHPLFVSFDLFRVLALDRREVAHTAVLARLLDPNGGHRGGGVILELLLSEYGKTSEQIDAHNVTVEAEHVISSGKAQGRRIDVLASGNFRNGEKFALVIEAKIDATEQEEQLESYQEYIESNHKRSFFLFLTEDARKGETDRNDSWVSLSYQDLYFLVVKAENLINCTETKMFLRWYCAGLLRWFCGCNNVFSEKSLTNPYRIVNLLSDSRWS